MTGVPLAPCVVADGSARGRPARRPHVLWFAPDGERAYWASSSEREGTSVWRLDLRTGESALLLQRPERSYVVVARDAGRVWWSAAHGAALRWFDVETGATGERACEPPGPLLGCSDDGAHLARGVGEGALEPWMVQSDVVIERADGGGPARRFTGLVSMGSVAFTGDGAWAVVFPEGAAARGLELATGATRDLAAVHTHGAYAAAERGGARVVSASPGRARNVLRPRDGRVVVTEAPGPDPRTLDFAAGVALHYGDRSGVTAVIARSVDAGTEREVWPSAGCRSALSPDGRRCLVHDTGPLWCVDLARGQTRSWHEGHDAAVTDLAWSADGRLLATVAADGSVRVWDLVARAVQWTFETGAACPRARAAFSPDGAALYGVGRGGFIAWDLRDGAERRRNPRVQDADVALEVSPDGGHLLLCGSHRAVRVFALAGEGGAVGSMLQPERGRMMRHAPRRLGATFAGPERVASLVRERVVQPRLDVVRWRRERYDLRGRFRGATEHPALDGCDLAPIEGAPGEVLVITDDGVGRCDLDAPDAGVRPLGPRDGAVLHATPGAMVCDRGGAELVVRGLVDGGPRARVAAGRAWTRVRLSPDGGLLAVAWAGGAVEVFDVRGGGAVSRGRA